MPEPLFSVDIFEDDHISVNFPLESTGDQIDKIEAVTHAVRAALADPDKFLEVEGA